MPSLSGIKSNYELFINSTSFDSRNCFLNMAWLSITQFKVCGNGISIIIFAGIDQMLPASLIQFGAIRVVFGQEYILLAWFVKY